MATSKTDPTPDTSTEGSGKSVKTEITKPDVPQTNSQDANAKEVKSTITKPDSDAKDVKTTITKPKTAADGARAMKSPQVAPNEEYQYKLIPDAVWPPPIYIRKDITNDERFYMEHRWHSQWAFFDKKASEAKRRHQRLQLIIGLGSVTVPVLVGIRGDTDVAQNGLYVLTVIISLAVAMAAAIENVQKYGDSWRSYRHAAEELLQEKSLYDNRAGRYADIPSPFLRFVERVEEVIAQQNGRWIQVQEKAQQAADEQSKEILDKARGRESSDTADNSGSAG